MINPLIKTQLNNCRSANIPIINDETYTIHMPRSSDQLISQYQIGTCYLIELADYIIHPSPEFTLAENWNQGRVPSFKHYKAVITGVQGKMLKFLGSGYDIMNDQDTTTVWEGWVPQKGVKILETYK